MDQKLITIGLLYVLALVSGLWMGRTRGPRNTFVFTVHKLSALGALVLGYMFVRGPEAGAPLTPQLWGLFAVAGVLLSILIVTGSLISLPQPMLGKNHTVHKIMPYALGAALAGFAATILL